MLFTGLYSNFNAIFYRLLIFSLIVLLYSAGYSPPPLEILEWSLSQEKALCLINRPMYMWYVIYEICNKKKSKTYCNVFIPSTQHNYVWRILILLILYFEIILFYFYKSTIFKKCQRYKIFFSTLTKMWTIRIDPWQLNLLRIQV